jgi:hypothetical protein
MRFEEVYGRFQRGHLSCAEAADILGMSERSFLRGGSLHTLQSHLLETIKLSASWPAAKRKVQSEVALSISSGNSKSRC